MRTLKSLTLVVATTGLALVANASAAGPATVSTVSNVYTVESETLPGVNTGLVLEGGRPVTVTATGAFCPFGDSFCVGPDGEASIDTTDDFFGGFVLPGAPAWGLVGRVGDGPWVQVGSGPTTLSGSGVLELAVNDDWWEDNAGSFTAVVSYSYSCYPGWGYGDANHTHCGPPGLDPDGCFPGWGYGDANHTHCGPPGLVSKPPRGSSSEHGASPSSGSATG